MFEPHLKNVPQRRAGPNNSVLRWTVIATLIVVTGLIAFGFIFLRLTAPTYPPYFSGPCYTPPGGKPPFKPDTPYLYEAPPERQAVINAGAKHLKRGMSREDVRTIMGDPDIDQGAYVPMVYNLKGEYRGIIWTYILRSVDPGGTNLNYKGDALVDFDKACEKQLEEFAKEYETELELP